MNMFTTERYIVPEKPAQLRKKITSSIIETGVFTESISKTPVLSRESDKKKERRIELLQNEIQLADDECCIVFDFACYFPYTNPEILTFGFSLGMLEISDAKLNHRNTNCIFHTISKKYGNKVSKIGYPFIMKLDNQGMFLCLKTGIKDNYITTVFQVDTDMTKDKPVCGLCLRYDFDAGNFCFTSYRKREDGWYQHKWSNRKRTIPWEYSDDVYMDCLDLDLYHFNSRTIEYNGFIRPDACSLSDLLLRRD